MRENRLYGLEGGESGSTGLPYPYRFAFAADGSRSLARSHLSPDGGSVTRHAPTPWQRITYPGTVPGSLMGFGNKIFT